MTPEREPLTYAETEALHDAVIAWIFAPNLCVESFAAGRDYARAASAQEIAELRASNEYMKRTCADRQKWRSRMGLTPSADALLDRAEKAEAALAEARKDAGRYRWLQCHAEVVRGLRLDWFPSEASTFDAPDHSLDAAIDAAIAAQAPAAQGIAGTPDKEGK